MKFTETTLPGVWIVDPEPYVDERGSFWRTWCREEFAEHGLPTEFVQCSASRTTRRGTIRGLHWQEAPYEEDKFLRCVRGAIWEVVLDLRPHSPHHLQHVAVELSEDNGRAVLVPKGFAHGFQTLTDHVEVHYQMTEFYHPSSQRGVRWNDPAFAIEWPLDNPILHPRDASYPDYRGLA